MAEQRDVQFVLRRQCAQPKRYLIRRPKALQYLHNGEVKREHEGERQAGRFELFLDLLCMLKALAIPRALTYAPLDVAMVANFADDLTKNPSGAEFVKYILIFAAAWYESCLTQEFSDCSGSPVLDHRRAWSDLKNFMNNYYNDDLFQRSLTLWYMALLVIYGNNATEVDQSMSALRTTVSVYLMARSTISLVYTLYSFATPYHRPQNRVFAALNFIGFPIWTPLYFESVSLRVKIAVAIVALVYEVSSTCSAMA